MTLASGPPDPAPPDGPPGRLSVAVEALPPPVMVLFAILSIQIGAAIAVQLFPIFGASGTVFLRVSLAALLLMLAWRPRLGAHLRRHAGMLLLFGAVFGGMNLCFYEAIARVPLGIVVTVEFVGPLGVAVVTSRRLRDFLWIALAGFGIALFAPDVGQDLDPLGLGFAGLAACGWAAFVLLSKPLGRAFPGGGGLALGMLAAAILLAPLGLPRIGPVFEAPLLLLVAFGIALLSTTIPFSLEFAALRRMPPRTYGLLVTLEPAVACLVGALLLGETLSPRAMLAVACVTAAALGATVLERRGG